MNDPRQPTVPAFDVRLALRARWGRTTAAITAVLTMAVIAWLWSIGPSASSLAADNEMSLPAVTRVTDGDLWWYLRDEHSSGHATNVFQYGRAGDRPVMGDWDGDGIATVGVVSDDHQWRLRNDNSAGQPHIVFHFDEHGEPVVGDWDGDGVDEPGVFGNVRACRANGETTCRDAGSRWSLRFSLTGGPADVIIDFDEGGHHVVGDWDGDGDDAIGTVNGNTWHLSAALDDRAEISFNYGTASDTPIAGDWNQDGTTTPGVFRNGTWYLRNGLSSGYANTSFRYGSHNDTPHTWTQPK